MQEVRKRWLQFYILKTDRNSAEHLKHWHCFGARQSYQGTAWSTLLFFRTRSCWAPGWIKMFEVTVMTAWEMPKILALNFCSLMGEMLITALYFTTYCTARFCQPRFLAFLLQHAAFVSTCVCGALKSWRKMNQVAKRCLERVSSPLARVVLLSSEVLPSFPVLDSILPCCSPSVAVYHSHLCVLRKKSLKQSNNHSCFLFVLKPWFFQIMFLVLLFQLSAQKGKRKS